MNTRRAGKARAPFITRRWDAAVPFEDATKERFAAEALTEVSSIWADGTEHGWRVVARDAGNALMRLTAEAGFDPGFQRLKEICELTRSFCERGRKYRALAIMDKDVKRHFDDQPRIRRDASHLDPMELIRRQWKMIQTVREKFTEWRLGSTIP